MKQFRFLSWAVPKIILNLLGREINGGRLNGSGTCPKHHIHSLKSYVGQKMGEEKMLTANPKHKIPKENQTGPAVLSHVQTMGQESSSRCPAEI